MVATVALFARRAKYDGYDGSRIARQRRDCGAVLAQQRGFHVVTQERVYDNRREDVLSAAFADVGIALRGGPSRSLFVFGLVRIIAVLAPRAPRLEKQ